MDQPSFQGIVKGRRTSCVEGPLREIGWAFSFAHRISASFIYPSAKSPSVPFPLTWLSPNPLGIASRFCKLKGWSFNNKTPSYLIFNFPFNWRIEVRFPFEPSRAALMSAPMRFAACFFGSSSRCAYRCVVVISVWPSIPQYG